MLLRDLGIKPDTLLFDKALDALDADGSGRVDLQEFTAWYSDNSAPIEHYHAQKRRERKKNIIS